MSRPRTHLLDASLLRRLSKTHSQEDIAEELGCSRSLVVVRQKELGIPARGQVVRYPALYSRKKLEKLLEKHSLRGVARKLGCAVSLVHRRVQHYGIEGRKRG